MTRLALKNPVTTLLLAVMLLTAGLVSYLSMPTESFPEIKIPLVFVNTVYPGAAPEDIENLVTRKIEDELDGLDGLKKYTSQSMESVSAIQVEFNPDVEVEAALRRVKDKVDMAKAELPPDAEEPIVMELNFSNIPIFVVSLSSTYEMEKLEGLAERLKDRIRIIPGVLDAKITGKQEKEVRIEALPAQLHEYDLTLQDLVDAIQGQHRNVPGGVLVTGGNRFSVQVTGELRDPAQFKDIIVRSEDGSQVRLGDVADVRFDYKPERSSIARLNGEPSLAISVTKRTGENIIDMVESIKSVVEETQATWPLGTAVEYTFDQSTDIKHMVTELQNHIVLGVLLVLGLLSFFLGVRNAFFISTAIPFSMALGFLVLHLMDTSLNMVVLFSLIIALGMLVDDGIVVVENIYRHLHMNKSRFQAALDGTREVALPVTTATITTIAAFAPILFMPGIMGEFMYYLPLTVSVTLAGSLFVAFIFNPVFASLFMTKRDSKGMDENDDDGWFKSVRRFYERTLHVALEHPILLGLFNFVFLVGGIMAYGMSGKGVVFFPVIEPKVVVAEIEGPLGMDIHETDAAMRKVEDVVLAMPKSKGDLSNVSSVIGFGKSDGISTRQTETHKAYMDIDFGRYETRKVSSWKSMEWLQDTLPKALPGWRVTISQQEEGPPQGHPVEFLVSGEDYQTLATYADSIRNRLAGVPDLVNITSDYDPAQPEIRVNVDREQASRLGLSTTQVAMAVRGAIHGHEAGKFRQGDEEHDIMVRLADPIRKSHDVFSQITVGAKDGPVPLTSVARLEQTANIASINHVDGKRTVQVYTELTPGISNQEKPKSLALAAVQAMPTPPAYSVQPGTANKDQEESQRFLIQAFFIAMALVFFTMVAQFNSLAQPFFVVAGIFFSLGGVYWGMLFVNVLGGDVTFSIMMSGIGIIALAGVVAKNGIVLIDFINAERARGTPLREAVIVGGSTRLRPVLLTAITAMIALVGMATGVGFDFFHFEPILKSETSMWWKPMAWALFFGLGFNTLLTLVGVPVYYYAWERLKEWAFNRKGKAPTNGRSVRDHEAVIVK